MRNMFYNKKLYIFIITNLTLLIICFNFNYNSVIGGGIFYKISLLVLNNNLILFLSSFLGLFLILFFNNNRFDYLVLMLIIVLSFSSGIYIFQKYFEPLMFFIFILLFDRSRVEEILKNKLDFLIFYFSLYWVIYFFYTTGKISIN